MNDGGDDDAADVGEDGGEQIEGPVPVFPWEPNEKLFRELYNMFMKRAKKGPSTFSGDVVDFHPGSFAEKWLSVNPREAFGHR